MLGIASIQTTVRGLIAAHADFSSDLVVANVGASEGAIEDALASRGVAVEVLPVYEATTPEHGGSGSSIAIAEVIVFLSVNPKTNPTGANLDIRTGVRSVIESVLNYTPGKGDRTFELGTPVFRLTEFHPGLVQYEIHFLKTTNLS
jgi:hypothetical protein